MGKIRITESQLHKVIKESVKRVLRENDDEPFMNTGLSDKSKHFKRFDTEQGPLVLYNGKVYKWNFVDFMRNRDSMIEKYGTLSNKAVGDWMSNGGLQQMDVDVNTLDGMQNDWQKSNDEENRKASIIKKYRAEYENACDDLYYGYGFKSWVQQQQRSGSQMTDDDAKIVWRAAFNKMANKD